MDKKDIKGTQEERLINEIIKTNSHLLKDLIFNKVSLEKNLKFICKNYLIKKGFINLEELKEALK